MTAGIRPPRLLKQPTTRTCAQTVVAMVTRIPIATSIQIFGHNHMVYAWELLRAFRLLGYDVGKFRRGRILPTRCVVRLAWKGSPSRHVYYKGSFYEPASGRRWKSLFPGLRITSWLEV